MRIRDEQKEQLVREKAMELLGRDGFQGFTMQKLALAANISPATLYIYYKDKDELIKKIGVELGDKMAETTLEGFSPTMSFADGLKKQWENRAKFWIDNKNEALCYEAIRHSPHMPYVMQHTSRHFRPVMEEFIRNAIANNEVTEMPFEVFWSVAYGPLYNLIRFHLEGRSHGDKKFSFSKKAMYETLELVLKAFRSK